MTQSVQRNNHVLQMLKRLKDTLDNDKKRYADKVNLLVMTWERIAGSGRQHRPLATMCILEKMYKDTIDIVLQGDWPQISPASKTHLCQMLTRCRTDLCSGMAWLGNKLMKLLDLVGDPWTSPILERILHSTPIPATLEQVTEFCATERGLLIISRLSMLCLSRCEKVAIKLAEACYKTLTTNPSSYVLSLFTTEEYHFILDIYLCLLFKYKRVDTVIKVLQPVSTKDGCHLVIRLQTRSASSRPGPELKVWKFSREVASIASKFFVAVSMLSRATPDVGLMDTLVREWLCLNNGKEFNVEVEVRKVIIQAETSQHIYAMADALSRLDKHQQYFSLVVELYIRAITTDVNYMEGMKLCHDRQQITTYEKHLSDKFLAFADLVKDHCGVRREFVLTAFSIHPSADIYRRVEEEAVASGKASPHSTPSQESIEPGGLSDPNLSNLSCEDAKYDSVNNDSQDSGAFVELSNRCPLHLPYDGIGPEGDLCFRCGDFIGIETPRNLQVKKERCLDALILIKGNAVTESLNYDPIRAPSQVLEAEKLGLSPQVCADLVTLIGSNRYHLLTWVLEWCELSSRCIRYINEAETIKSGKKELKFLEIDYTKYKDWPENQDEMDCIEKGYEKWLEVDNSNLDDDDSDRKECSSDDESDTLMKTVIRRSQKQMGRYAESSTDSEDMKARSRQKKRTTRAKKRFKYLTDSESVSDSLGSDGQNHKRPVKKPRTTAKDLRKRLGTLKVLEAVKKALPPEIPFGLLAGTNSPSDPRVLKTLRDFRHNKQPNSKVVDTPGKKCLSHVFDCDENRYTKDGYGDLMKSMKQDLVSVLNIPSVQNIATVNVVHSQETINNAGDDNRPQDTTPSTSAERKTSTSSQSTGQAEVSSAHKTLVSMVNPHVAIPTFTSRVTVTPPRAVTLSRSVGVVTTPVPSQQPNRINVAPAGAHNVITSVARLRQPQTLSQYSKNGKGPSGLVRCSLESQGHVIPNRTVPRFPIGRSVLVTSVLPRGAPGMITGSTSSTDSTTSMINSTSANNTVRTYTTSQGQATANTSYITTTNSPTPRGMTSVLKRSVGNKMSVVVSSNQSMEQQTYSVPQSVILNSVEGLPNVLVSQSSSTNTVHYLVDTSTMQQGVFTNATTSSSTSTTTCEHTESSFQPAASAVALKTYRRENSPGEPSSVTSESSPEVIVIDKTKPASHKDIHKQFANRGMVATVVQSNAVAREDIKKSAVEVNGEEVLNNVTAQTQTQTQIAPNSVCQLVLISDQSVSGIKSSTLPKFNQAFRKSYVKKVTPTTKPEDSNGGQCPGLSQVQNQDRTPKFVAVVEHKVDKTNQQRREEVKIIEIPSTYPQPVQTVPRVAARSSVVHQLLRKTPAVSAQAPTQQTVSSQQTSVAQTQSSVQVTSSPIQVSTLGGSAVQSSATTQTIQTVHISSPKVVSSNPGPGTVTMLQVSGSPSVSSANTVINTATSLNTVTVSSTPTVARTIKQDAVAPALIHATATTRPQRQILIQGAVNRVNQTPGRQTAPIIYTHGDTQQTQTVLLAAVPALSRTVTGLQGTQLVRLPSNSGVWKVATNPTATPSRIVQWRPQNLVLQGTHDLIQRGHSVLLHQVASLPVKSMTVKTATPDPPKPETDSPAPSNTDDNEHETVALMKDIKEFENVFEETKLKFEMEEQGVCLPEVEVQPASPLQPKTPLWSKPTEKRILLATTTKEESVSQSSPHLTVAYVSGGSSNAVATPVQKPLVVVTSYGQQPSSPAASTTSQSSSSPTSFSSTSQTAAKPSPVKTKSRNVKPVPNPSKSPPVSKPQQKPQEDASTTQKIYAILEEYAELARNSPDMNNRPAPRRRSNPPTSSNPKRKKSMCNKNKESVSDGDDASFSEDVNDPIASSEDSSSNVTVVQVCVSTSH